MTTQDETPARAPELQQKIDDWLRTQLDGHATHLFKHGLIDGRVQVAAAWALPGRLCIGTVFSADRRKAFWVISGDVPTDHLEANLASSAREAAKHFALKWQLQAKRLADSQAVGRADEDPAVWTATSDVLTRKAEALYAITELDEHWQNTVTE